MTFQWNKLQNGSDIRGIAISHGDEEANLSKEVAYAIGKAFVIWLRNKGYGNSKIKIGVGRDSRISGPDLLMAIACGLKSEGAEVIDCGLASTPAMFMGTIFKETDFAASVMITASHLPFNRNGFKFFTSDGGLEKEDITEILSIASKNFSNEPMDKAELSSFDLMSLYSNLFVDIIKRGVASENFNNPLDSMHIVVDAGNGAGGFFVEKVLKVLGADTKGSQFLEPDGMFPNHEPNPENDEAMRAIQEAVVKSKADLGIIFDTDVDRSAIVDSSGEIINRNKLIALMAAIVLAEHPSTTIVTDSVTSEGLTYFIEKILGGRHHRFKRGYKNVINEAIRLNESGEECYLAIETSGHGAMKENYFLDDGAYMAAKIIIKAALLRKEGRSILDLIKDMPLPVEEKEFRIKLLDDDFKAQGQAIIEELKKHVSIVDGWVPAQKNFEGYRVSCTNIDEKGWFLLRLSLHDPVLPLNVESEVIGGVKNIAVKLCDFLKRFENIEYSSLSKYAKNNDNS
ncbi:MAG TPA: phosphomannomutase/phosphoglucomutase [Spirochaetota bacterium]|nr:phosphomannomutase/phosphoglucomutase [Spirochaetota bacterium]HOV09838.1 phosphomannomutase/phosphoglucomutase [Spirochaetota bacterium]HPX90174.1 phosphomannomutase/phosphoglucomutase [Spirochaetota bacterium]